MNTGQLIAIVAQVTEQEKGAVGEALRVAFEVIADAPSDQEVVKLAGLGRLQVRQAGIGVLLRIPPHGVERRIAPYAVHFRPVRRLRDELHIRANHQPDGTEHRA